MFVRRWLTIAALAMTAGPVLAQNTLRVQEPWARPTVAGQAAGGGYLRIVGGAVADKLLSASSEVAGRVELHSMTMDGNVMRMRQVDGIDIPAGKTVELQPGGLHMMFMDLKAPLNSGSSFPLTLRFEKAGELKLAVKVQTGPAVAAQAAEHKEHKH